MGGTNLSDQSTLNGGTFNTYLTNDSGMAILVRCSTANIPSAKANFAVGCQLEDTTTGIWYSNTGTTSSCTFTKSSLVATGNKGYYAVTTLVSGTSNVNVFGTTNGFAATVTGVWAIAAGQGTSTTLTVTGDAGATIATVTTGTAVGVVTGATSLTNTAITSSGTMTVTSNNALDTSFVVVSFTQP